MWTILYTVSGDIMPRTFSCDAIDMEAAEQIFEEKMPNAFIAWAFEGDEKSAFEDYYFHNLQD